MTNQKTDIFGEPTKTELYNQITYLQETIEYNLIAQNERTLMFFIIASIILLMVSVNNIILTKIIRRLKKNLSQ